MAKGDTFMGIIILLLIALVFLMFLMVTQGAPSTANWEAGGYGQISYLKAGQDDTLYAFSGNDIYAIDSHGILKWNATVPDQWSLCLNTGREYVQGNITFGLPLTHTKDTPIFDSYGGNLYALVSPSPMNLTMEELSNIQWSGGFRNLSVISISPTGKVAWSLPISGNLSRLDFISIEARQEGEYVFHGYNETLIDKNGNVIWNLDNVSDPATVDEQGFVYTVSAVGRNDIMINYDWVNRTFFDYREPSSVISAYYPNGTLYWSRDIQEPVIRQPMSDGLGDQYRTLPLYNGGMLFVPIHNGMIALDRQGNEIWTKHFDEGDFRLLEVMPFDSYGNVYMRYVDVNDMYHSYMSSYIYVISLDGSRVSAQMPFDQWNLGGSNGVVYYVDDMPAVHISEIWSGSQFKGFVEPNRNLTDLDTVAIRAHDFLADRDIWRFVAPVNSTSDGVFTKDNVGQVFPYNVSYLIADDQNFTGTFSNNSLGAEAEVLPGKNIVYIVFSSLNYETPIIYNASKFTYSSGIYAFDNKGSLLWERPTDPFIKSATVNGSIIYYSTGDGKIVSASGLDVAAGLAAMAVIYVFIRFFLIGAVSRARARVDSNENRGRILKFIVASPGSNVPEISRALRINMGTVRYHLFILSMNHRVVSINADEKYLRYFTNSGMYSIESQRVISLMRRDGINKVLTLLSESPGLSNRELSLRSGIRESAMSRYLKELSERGIVQKEKSAGGFTSFFIEEAYKKHIASAMERLGGQ